MTDKEMRELSIDEIKDRLSEIKDEFDQLITDIQSDDTDDSGDEGGTEEKSASVEELEERAEELIEEKRSLQEILKEKEAEAEKRSRVEKVKEKKIPITKIEEKGKEMTDREERAKAFVESGKMEIRQVLSTGKIATPRAVGGIGEIAPSETGIVDDVNAIPLTGNGTYRAAYKKTDAAAADVTDGAAVAGTASTYDYVDINPAEWGVLDEISQQVAKMTPLDYQSAVANSAVNALRATASAKIVAAIEASDLTEAVTVAIDQDYLRTLTLGFHAIPGKGNVCLYIGQEDIATLSKVRGTNEKRPLYEFEFDAGTTTSGVIKEGGLATRFRILPSLAKGKQIFGQPGTVDMPMWGDYSVETDQAGDYFKRNMIGIRGLQTAGAGLVCYHGLQIVSQA